MLYLLSKTETRMIDLGDGFFAEVHVDTNSIGTKRKIIITNSDYPEVQYLAADSSRTKHGPLIESEGDVMNLLRNADNFKEVWHKKISEIDMIRKQFE